MSRFYGTIDGAGKNQATQRGHNALTTHAAGWKGAVRVDIGDDGKGNDTFTVSLVPWRNSGGQSREIATGLLDASTTAKAVEADHKAYQQQVCKRIVARMHEQGVTGTKTKNRTALELICGVCMGLEIAESVYLNPMLFLATMVSARGAEVVCNIAEYGTIDKPATAA